MKYCLEFWEKYIPMLEPEIVITCTPNLELSRSTSFCLIKEKTDTNQFLNINIAYLELDDNFVFKKLYQCI